MRQPEGTGPVLFSNSSPTYWNLKPVSESTGAAAGASSSDGGGIGGAGIAAIVVLALAHRRGGRVG